MASLKSEPIGKLINRNPGSRLLMSQVYQARLREHMSDRSGFIQTRQSKIP